jgi:hypothetical protein
VIPATDRAQGHPLSRVVKHVHRRRRQRNASDGGTSASQWHRDGVRPCAKWTHLTVAGRPCDHVLMRVRLRMILMAIHLLDVVAPHYAEKWLARPRCLVLWSRRTPWVAVDMASHPGPSRNLVDGHQRLGTHRTARTSSSPYRLNFSG